MKRLLKTIVFLILCTTAFICVVPAQSGAEEIIRGHSENQHYENACFDIQVDLPEEWRIMSDEELNRASAGMGNYFLDFYAQNMTNGNAINILVASISAEESDRFTEEELAETNYVTLKVSLEGNSSIKYPSLEQTTCIFAGKEHAAIKSDYATVMQKGGFGHGGETLLMAKDEIVFIVSGQQFAMVTASTAGTDPETILNLFQPMSTDIVKTAPVENDALFQTYLRIHPEYKYGTWIDTNQDGVKELLVSSSDNRVEKIPAVLCALSSDGQKLYTWKLYSGGWPFKYDPEENTVVCDISGTGVYERFVVRLSGDSLNVRHIGRKSQADRQESYYYDYTDEIPGGEDVLLYPRYGEVPGSPGIPDWEFLDQYGITIEEYEAIGKYYVCLDRMVFYDAPTFQNQ